jgi:hypothetical protein
MVLRATSFVMGMFGRGLRAFDSEFVSKRWVLICMRKLYLSYIHDGYVAIYIFFCYFFLSIGIILEFDSYICESVDVKKTHCCRAPELPKLQNVRA